MSIFLMSYHVYIFHHMYLFLNDQNVIYMKLNLNDLSMSHFIVVIKGYFCLPTKNTDISALVLTENYRPISPPAEYAAKSGQAHNDRYR